MPKWRRQKLLSTTRPLAILVWQRLTPLDGLHAAPFTTDPPVAIDRQKLAETHVHCFQRQGLKYVNEHWGDHMGTLHSRQTSVEKAGNWRDKLRNGASVRHPPLRHPEAPSHSRWHTPRCVATNRMAQRSARAPQGEKGSQPLAAPDGASPTRNNPAAQLLHKERNAGEASRIVETMRQSSNLAHCIQRQPTPSDPTSRTPEQGPDPVGRINSPMERRRSTPESRSTNGMCSLSPPCTTCICREEYHEAERW